MNVLAIDGGGIRGIIPALVLAELERRGGRPVAALFDLIAGTSTGGILALALTRPAAPGAPAFGAAELVDLYEREGPRIFDRSLLRRITSVEGFVDEKYSSDGLERALETYLGDARLSDSLTEVLLTAYEIEERRPFFFSSAAAREDPGRDVLMRDAALATSAAPTYFEPVRAGSHALIDGGVYAANPAMAGYAEVRRRDPGVEVFLVSLGTGELTRPIRYEEAKDWGRIEWVRPLIDVIFDGVSDAVDFQLRQLLPGDRYHRLQTVLDHASDDLDDASEENIRALKREGEQLVERASARLDAIAERLGD